MENERKENEKNVINNFIEKMGRGNTGIRKNIDKNPIENNGDMTKALWYDRHSLVKMQRGEFCLHKAIINLNHRHLMSLDTS